MAKPARGKTITGLSGERGSDSRLRWLRNEPNDEELMQYWEEKREELEGRLSNENWLMDLFSRSSGLESFFGSFLGSVDLFAILLVVS